jgi:imidazolonepropionase-like amidohydrolase
MKKHFLVKGLLGLLMTGMVIQSSWAQSDPSGKRRITSTYAITNATVQASPGQQPTKATILIKDGVILGIGSNLSLPKEASVISGDSLYVYPGFIDGAGSMGVTRPKDPERPKDFVSSNPPDEIAGITPWRSATDQFDGANSQVEDWRKAGFTVSQIIPDGGMLPGKAAVMVLGQTGNTNLIQINSAMAANFRGSRGMYPATLAGVMAKFRDVYKNSSLAIEHEKLFASTVGVSRPQVTPTHSAMAPVIQGQMPVIFTAGTDLEIRRAIALQKEFGFKMVLNGLENYENVIDLIKSSNIPVLVKLEIPDDKSIKAQKESNVTEATQAQYERVKAAYDQALKQAGMLEKAGIAFAFTTSGAKAGDAWKAIGAMIKNGLSEKAALAALTTNPAQILGISRTAGTIEKGKMANLVITTAPLFTEDAQVKHVVADGYFFDYEVKKKTNGNGKTDGAVKVDGVWEYTSETPAGNGSGEITLKKNGSSYEGTITYDDPSGSGKATAPIKNVTVSGNSLSFDFDVNAGGMSLTVTISGQIDGNTMDGSLSVPQMGSFPVKASLSSPSLIP